MPQKPSGICTHLSHRRLGQGVGQSPGCLSPAVPCDSQGLPDREAATLSWGIGICSSHPWLLLLIPQESSKELTKLPWVRALQFNTGYKVFINQTGLLSQEPGRPPACVFCSWAFTCACCPVLWLTGPLSLLWSMKNCMAACLTVVAAGHSSTITQSLSPALPWPCRLVHPYSHRSSARLQLTWLYFPLFFLDSTAIIAWELQSFIIYTTWPSVALFSLFRSLYLRRQNITQNKDLTLVVKMEW